MRCWLPVVSELDSCWRIACAIFITTVELHILIWFASILNKVQYNEIKEITLVICILFFPECRKPYHCRLFMMFVGKEEAIEGNGLKDMPKSSTKELFLSDQSNRKMCVWLSQN
jgi:hypothetical protein